MTDVYLNDDTPSEGHRLVVIDIETSSEGGFPNVETADKKIVSIALYDSVTEEYHVYILDKSGLRSSFKKENVSIRFFTEEYDLLYHFLDLWEGINPTIVTGWNSDHFDIPYLYRRIGVILGLTNSNRLSSIGRVKFSTYREKYNIAGVSCLDYLDLYKKFTFNELPNYRLDTVGRLELEIGKIEYEGTLDELLDSDISEFIKYNLRDVEIVAGLEKKLKLIELARAICHLGHVPYEDYGYSSRWLEGTIVTFLHRKGLVVTDKDPSNKDKMDDEEKFAGAYVKVPFASKHEWVFSLDLQSLYPSIIRTLNISPETKIARVLNWNPNNEDSVKVTFEVIASGEKKLITTGQFKELIKDGNMSVSSNGIVYSLNSPGVIPEILNTWFAARIEYRDLMKKYATEGDKEKAQFYDKRQHIQKIFLNSLYGYLGLPISRFYDTDNALAVTSTGQTIIKESVKYCNLLYFKWQATPRSQESLIKYEQLLKNVEYKTKTHIDRNILDIKIISIELDDGSTKDFLETDVVNVIRSDVKSMVLAKNILNTDILVFD